jgi:NAD(P)-dependent dehydrogenase (short-subunit alcohol dehydrogenase family)
MMMKAGRAGEGRRTGGETRKVLITGGSSGIGAATALAFAARGFAVAVTGLDDAGLRAVAGQACGVSIVGDLRERGRPRRIVEAAAQALGGLDVVVSNAGEGWRGPFAAMTDEDIDSLLDLNLRASAQVARAALAHLPQGTGHLVFIGSIAGLLGVPGEAWYSATKAGLGMLAEVLRAELRADGIRVTLVAPTVVDTAFYERRNSPYLRRRPRPVSPQVVADAIVEAVTRGREVVVIPGWVSWPARLKVNFPGLYRLLERRLDSQNAWQGEPPRRNVVDGPSQPEERGHRPSAPGAPIRPSL